MSILPGFRGLLALFLLGISLLSVAPTTVLADATATPQSEEDQALIERFKQHLAHQTDRPVVARGRIYKTDQTFKLVTIIEFEITGVDPDQYSVQFTPCLDSERRVRSTSSKFKDFDCRFDDSWFHFDFSTNRLLMEQLRATRPSHLVPSDTSFWNDTREMMKSCLLVNTYEETISRCQSSELFVEKDHLVWRLEPKPVPQQGFFTRTATPLGKVVQIVINRETFALEEVKLVHSDNECESYFVDYYEVN